MNKVSPLTGFIVNPICEKIFNNINDNGIQQLCAIFLVICIYFMHHKEYNRSSFIYILYFLCIFELNKRNTKDIDMLFILINLAFLVFNIKLKSNNSTYILASILVLILTVISHSVRNYIKPDNSKWNKIINKIGVSIYPKNDETKAYHIDKFWNIFDISLFGLFIYVSIGSQKKINIYF